ncbi:amidase [Cupriavidus malaysiensis]|uniref:Amidase n=1 Tax=Cupriavidus malaysiensis TaxID=367825 RepID=A0ABM6FAX2_9BURK|nr:amidase [Cupriavidus malaysiensis]AOZ08868.1 amidase [Cupriavidus malaysiensis]
MNRQDLAGDEAWQQDSQDLRFLPVWQAAARLARGETCAMELVDCCETAYRQGHASINALVLADFDAARAAAARSDARRARGQALGPLDGIPFSIKESFDVAGWPTTCGNPAHAGNVPAADAAVLERLRAAGAVLLGKTNVPIALRDWQSYNALYGTTRNPHDPSRTPGGSSGGSAAAVCAGMSFFDIGSDIGSSLRNPAHYCGVFSHKSSHGVVPLRGHGIGTHYGEQEINVAGPLARSARDLELVLDTLAGPDGETALAWRLQLPACPRQGLADFRVAVLPTHALAEADSEVGDQIEGLGRWLEAQGAQVAWHRRPDFDADELWHTYVTMLRATTSVHMDEAGFGAVLAQAAGLDPQRRDYAALQYTGAGIRHRDWLQLQQKRAAFAASWQRFFAEFDVLLCPAAVTTAFPIDESGEPWQRTLAVNGGTLPLTSQLFWAGHSGLCGLPSTVAPIGPGRSGLPVGVQIVAARYADLTSLRFARLLEQAGFAFRPPAASPRALP